MLEERDAAGLVLARERFHLLRAPRLEGLASGLHQPAADPAVPPVGMDVAPQEVLLRVHHPLMEPNAAHYRLGPLLGSDDPLAVQTPVDLLADPVADFRRRGRSIRVSGCVQLRDGLVVRLAEFSQSNVADRPHGHHPSNSLAYVSHGGWRMKPNFSLIATMGALLISL